MYNRKMQEVFRLSCFCTMGDPYFCQFESFSFHYRECDKISLLTEELQKMQLARNPNIFLMEESRERSGEERDSNRRALFNRREKHLSDNKILATCVLPSFLKQTPTMPP
jgi:hypothetical protein